MTTTIAPKSQITATGSVVISTSKYIVGFSSLYLPGNTNPNTSRLIITGYPYNQLNSSWTIEFYVFIPSIFQGTGNSECVPISIGNSYNSYIYVSCVNNNFNWFIGTPTTEPFYYNISSYQTTPFRINDWNHIAFSFNGSAYMIYCNGILRYKRLSSVNNGIMLKNLYLGTFFNGEYNFSGGGCFIDGLRISKAIRYTTTEGASYPLPFTSTTIPAGITTRPPSNYVPDASTVYINTFEGLNNSTKFQLNEYMTPS
jgi:hypothetical protein